MKRKVVAGAEQDAFTGWKHFINWRAGERAAIKQRANKRERREARDQIRRELSDG